MQTLSRNSGDWIPPEHLSDDDKRLWREATAVLGSPSETLAAFGLHVRACLRLEGRIGELKDEMKKLPFFAVERIADDLQDVPGLREIWWNLDVNDRAEIKTRWRSIVADCLKSAS